MFTVATSQEQLTNHFSNHEDEDNEASCNEPNLCLTHHIICDFHMTIVVRFFNRGVVSGKNNDSTTIWNLTYMEGGEGRVVTMYVQGNTVLQMVYKIFSSSTICTCSTLQNTEKFELHITLDSNNAYEQRCHALS